MTVTPMESSSPPVESPPLPSTEPYSLPPVLRPARPRREWGELIRSHERRLWTVALAATLLTAAGGLGLLYVDDTNNQATIRNLTTANESLNGRNQNLEAQLTVTQGKLTASQAQVDKLSTELQHPTLGVWNVKQTLHGRTEFLSATVPDTFIYHLKLTSNAPMDVSIMSTKQFTQAVICVNNGVGDTDYCMNHSSAAYGRLGVTSVNYDFTLAEGCAAYLAVITDPSSAALTITPDVSVTYNPASSPTGACT